LCLSNYDLFNERMKKQKQLKIEGADFLKVILSEMANEITKVGERLNKLESFVELNVGSKKEVSLG